MKAQPKPSYPFHITFHPDTKLSEVIYYASVLGFRLQSIPRIVNKVK